MAEVKKQRLVAIGLRIRMCRMWRGFTQAAMADYLGIRPESYNYIENGKRDMKTEEIIRLAELLQVTADYLLTGSKTDNSTKLKPWECLQEFMENATDGELCTMIKYIRARLKDRLGS